MVNPLILQYHKVTSRFEIGGTRVTPKQFEKHIITVKNLGYKNLDVNELLEPSKSFHQKSVLFTFDDGFECVYTQAFPLLKKHGYSGAVFIVTGFIGRENDWDASFGLRFRHLSEEQIIELDRSGWLIGSHSHTHPDLRKLTDRELEAELRVSKERLEDIVNHEVTAFAYPFGLHDKRVEKFLASVGYSIAFTSRKTYTMRLKNPFSVERQGVYLIDWDLRTKLDNAFPVGLFEFAKQRIINMFASLSSIARHDFRLMAKLAGMSFRTSKIVKSSDDKNLEI